MTVCTLMLATVLPIQLTYYWGDILPGWEPIWVLVDICLCADVALGFLVTSLDPKTMHYMEPPQVMWCYLRTWFVVDVLAMWPLGITASPRSAVWGAQGVDLRPRKR